MAISRIPGYSLISQLDRQGTDLSFVSTTNSGVLGSTLVYMDFTGFTVGVNEANPAQYGQSLVVTGNFLSNAGHILTTSNLQYNLGNVTNQWSSIWAGNIIGSTLTGTLSTAAQHNITSLGTLTSLSLSGNITSSGNLVSSLGNTTTWWNTLYTGTVTATNINGTIQTASQLYIANLGNITVNSISVGGNVVIGGNINGATITANAFIQSGYHVLDANTNISVTGDVVGSGTYSNIAVQLQSSGVTAGTYGNITEMPVITVNSKGLLTNITYIPLATTGNLIFVNTTISSLSNITLSSAANNNIILNTPGTGIVQITGSNALEIPTGNTAQRPTSPYTGYIRFNTQLLTIEFYDGTAWNNNQNGTITSQTITPTGLTNIYTLTTAATTDAVLVNINGAMQQPISAYNVVGNIITFTETPLTSDIIEIRSISISSHSITAISDGAIGVSASAVTGNLAVTGNMSPTSNLTYNIGSPSLQWNNIYAGNISTGSFVNLSPNTSIPGSNTITTIDSYDKTIYRTAKYIVQATTILDSESYEVMVTHNGLTTARNTVYGIINTGNSLGNISTSISGDSVLLQYTSFTANTNTRVTKSYTIL